MAAAWPGAHPGSLRPSSARPYGGDDPLNRRTGGPYPPNGHRAASAPRYDAPGAIYGEHGRAYGAGGAGGGAPYAYGAYGAAAGGAPYGGGAPHVNMGSGDLGPGGLSAAQAEVARRWDEAATAAASARLDARHALLARQVSPRGSRFPSACRPHSLLSLLPTRSWRDR